MINLCPPAIIYLIFSITQILIDLYKKMYNNVIMKIIVTIMLTLLLNILCEKNLSGVSWTIVLIPFILMTILVSVLLYFFGLDAATGSLDYTCKTQNNTTTSNPKGVTTDSYGNIIIYDPKYNPVYHPVYYQSPNIIVPNPELNTTTTTSTSYYPFPNQTSDPEYQSK